MKCKVINLLIFNFLFKRRQSNSKVSLVLRRPSCQDIQRRVRSDTASSITTKAERDWRGNDCEELFQEDPRKTYRDVTSIKVSAFTFPEVLPVHLRWFWVAKGLAIIPRYLMTGEIVTQEKFSYSDARHVLALFLSPEVMEFSVEAAVA